MPLLTCQISDLSPIWLRVQMSSYDLSEFRIQRSSDEPEQGFQCRRPPSDGPPAHKNTGIEKWNSDWETKYKDLIPAHPTLTPFSSFSLSHCLVPDELQALKQKLGASKILSEHKMFGTWWPPCKAWVTYDMSFPTLSKSHGWQNLFCAHWTAHRPQFFFFSNCWLPPQTLEQFRQLLPVPHKLLHSFFELIQSLGFPPQLLDLLPLLDHLHLQHLQPLLQPSCQAPAFGHLLCEELQVRLEDEGPVVPQELTVPQLTVGDHQFWGISVSAHLVVVLPQILLVTFHRQDTGDLDHPSTLIPQKYSHALLLRAFLGNDLDPEFRLPDWKSPAVDRFSWTDALDFLPKILDSDCVKDPIWSFQLPIPSVPGRPIRRSSKVINKSLNLWIPGAHPWESEERCADRLWLRGCEGENQFATLSCAFLVHPRFVHLWPTCEPNCMISAIDIWISVMISTQLTQKYSTSMCYLCPKLY